LVIGEPLNISFSLIKIYNKNMRILAIETSCDETSLAYVLGEGGLKNLKFKVIRNVVSSQVKLHAPFGGIVPNIAKREHLKNLPLLFNKFFKNIKKPDLIAVTIGPGLEPALWTGINFAKNLHKEKYPQSKIIGVNHIEGHLYSFLLLEKKLLKNKKIFPSIALIVSGGHTILLYLESINTWRKLGETRDDAVGETFDKVGRMLNLPYPGGPNIEKIARFGKIDFFNFPRPMINHRNYDFSFSGLKTAVLYFLKENQKSLKDEKFISNIAASFEKAAFDVLVFKTKKASLEYKSNSIILAGGVAANKLLRKMLKNVSKELKIDFFAPPMKYNTDNAAMIGVAGYVNFLKKKETKKLVAKPNLSI